MTREEHLQWAKQRALEYVDRGELGNAYASMVSDLRKHTELEKHIGLELGAQLLFSGFLNTQREMRKWITGFN